MSACLVSSAHLRDPSFRSVSSDIFLRTILSTAAQLESKKLTRPSLSDLFSRNPKNIEDLHHYFGNCIHKFFVKCRLCVDLESLEKSFYAIEYLKKSVLARANITCCLRAVHITTDRTKVLRGYTLKEEHRFRQRSLSRARIPVKKMRTQISDMLIS